MKNGDRFGHWTIVDSSSATKKNGYYVRCKCECGYEGERSKRALLAGSTKSCGCRGVYPGAVVGEFVVKEVFVSETKTNRYAVVVCKHGVEFKSMLLNGGLRVKSCPCSRSYVSNLKHGESSQKIRTPEYNAWRLMRQRCNDKNNKHYSSYGGRGISVCERWNDYSNFIVDMGRRPDGMSLDRIDPDGNYTPENCRWAENIVQQRNKRCSLFLEHEGVVRHLKEWADVTGICYGTLYQRLAKTSDSFQILKEYCHMAKSEYAA